MGRKAGWILLIAAAASAEDWTRELSALDPARRIEAAEALAKEGAAGAVSELAECLIDEDTRLRTAAAKALGRAGPAAKSAVPELRRLFTDPDATVQATALVAVARIGALDVVEQAVREDKRRIKRLAGEPEVLRSLLSARSWHVRLWVLQCERMRRDAPAGFAEPLAKLVENDPAEAVRVHALVALQRMKRPEAVAPLVRLSREEDERIRAAVTITLGRWIEGREAVVDALEARLDDQNPRIRAHAAYALRERRESLPKIRLLLEAKPRELRVVAAAVLGGQGEWVQEFAGPLTDIALDSAAWDAPFPIEYKAWRRNLRAGGGWGWPNAASTYPGIDRLARIAVLRSDGKAAPLVESRLGQAEAVEERVVAIYVLGHLRNADALRRALSDREPEARRSAAASLAVIGEANAEACRVLVDCLEAEPDELEKELVTKKVDWDATAAPLLGKIGKPALPTLEARLDASREPRLRKRLRRVIAYILER
jgi:HEAT repeat protein